MNESTPVLSLRTRELRWQRVRDLMRAHDLGCLLVGGLRGGAACLVVIAALAGRDYIRPGVAAALAERLDVVA